MRLVTANHLGHYKRSEIAIHKFPAIIPDQYTGMAKSSGDLFRCAGSFGGIRKIGMKLPDLTGEERTLLPGKITDGDHDIKVDMTILFT